MWWKAGSSPLFGIVYHCSCKMKIFSKIYTTWHQALRRAGVAVLQILKNNIQICSSEHFQLLPASPHQLQDAYFSYSFRDWNHEASIDYHHPSPTLRMQTGGVIYPHRSTISNMCSVCGIWDLKLFFPANDSSVPLVCWRLPTTKQSWHSADRPDLWLLFCLLLLSLWLQAICRTQTASLFPHHGSALKVLNLILHSGHICKKKAGGQHEERIQKGWVEVEDSEKQKDRCTDS